MLEIKIPSLLRLWFHGTTVTDAPLSHKHRIWLYFIPQSTANIFTLPAGLYTFGVYETITY